MILQCVMKHVRIMTPLRQFATQLRFSSPHAASGVVENMNADVDASVDVAVLESKRPAADTMTTALVLIPPRQPLDSECCGNGCADCVWIQYFNAAEAYRTAVLHNS
ncbi:mitochondrial oxidoreductase-like protein [Andalucia godoyi]|uniref:Mitochondrial oxidoreductase-like protein n=1 Tax=Andalucia godoyi TaxID=505711 RepID=A0A8K0F149_ANDGO|nr:mitochondrial oxidoreductase-like protein [Andalucia godoyi]|eukprot:ANDGO_07093.mRNA.1 mitochondrial oxidoreductase-like protein